MGVMVAALVIVAVALLILWAFRFGRGFGIAEGQREAYGRGFQAGKTAEEAEHKKLRDHLYREGWRLGYAAGEFQAKHPELNTDEGNCDEGQMTMTVPEQIAQFLQKNKPLAYCDSCIQDALGLKRHQQVQQTTSGGAAAGGFVRVEGTCSSCGKDVKVTHVG